jgi:hypothetical protein
MQRRVLSLSGLTLAGLVVVAGAFASPMSGGPRMGPASMVERSAWHGFYDGHQDTYLNTDVSDKAEAKSMHVNYAPGLKTVPLNSAPEIYLVQGKAATGQLAVFGSEPGEASYSPIWKETILTWEVQFEAGSDQERHSGRPTGEERGTDRALDQDQAQLPDHQGRLGVLRRP